MKQLLLFIFLLLMANSRRKLHHKNKTLLEQKIFKPKIFFQTNKKSENSFSDLLKLNLQNSDSKDTDSVDQNINAQSNENNTQDKQDENIKEIEK